MKYYINDKMQDTRKYLIKKDDCFYVGCIGVKKESLFLKFRLTPIYKIETKNIKQVNFNNFNNSLQNLLNGYITKIDYKKLYLR